MKKILSLSEILPDLTSFDEDPFTRCIFIQGLQRSLSTAALNAVLTRAFGPVSESAIFTSLDTSTVTSVCIFVHEHSASVAAGVDHLASNGDALARRFLAILGPDVSIKRFDPRHGEGIMVAGRCSLKLPNIRVISLDGKFRPSTPSTETTSIGDASTPRFDRTEWTARTVRILSSAVEPLRGEVSDEVLRKRFSVGRLVDEDNCSSSVDEEDCAQQ